jgi:myosin heavy subunit
LEAFGNAPTIFNSNSSRFVNYLEMYFNFDGVLERAKIQDFMLEKSRVVLEQPNERNFLIYYYMLSGLDKDALNHFQLESIQKHK